MNRKHFIQQCLASAFPAIMEADKESQPYERYRRGAERLWERMSADGLGDAKKAPISPRESAYDQIPDRDRFDQFWKAYGFAKDREGAARAWLAIPNRDKLADTIIKAAEMARREAQENPDTARKYPQGWLSGRRWEDFDVKGRTQQSQDNAAQRAIQDAVAELRALQQLPPSDEINQQITEVREKMRQLRG